MKVGALAAATAIVVSALLVDRAAASAVDTLHTLATAGKEAGLTIRHLRARAPVIGADDIWDNETSPELRCTMGGGGSSGCSSAPACDNVGQCTEKEMKCKEYQWTICRGCFKGAPACPSGFSCKALPDQPSDFKHQGGGAYCSLACCYRIGVKTHKMNCPRTGCKKEEEEEEEEEKEEKSPKEDDREEACDGGCVGAIIGIVIGTLVGFCLCCVLPCVLLYKHLRKPTGGGTSIQSGPAYPIPNSRMGCTPNRIGESQQPNPAPPRPTPFAPSHPTTTHVPVPRPLENACIECRTALPSSARFCGNCGCAQQRQDHPATGFVPSAPPPPGVRRQDSVPGM